MDPVSAIASLIAIYQLASTISGLCFHYGQGVRRADRDADLVINEIVTFQRYLRTLKEILAKEDLASDGADRLHNVNEIINGESAALNMCRKELDSIRIKLTKVQSEGRFKEAIHKLSWPLKQEEVSRTLNCLKKFTEAVDRALNVDNNMVIHGIDTRTKQMESSLDNLESQQKRDKIFIQQSQEEQRANEIKEKILDWLAHPDPSESHDIARRPRKYQAKTGRWFLDGSVFKEFWASPGSVLWLHGDSGSGKTVLCSAIIDEILAAQSRDSQIELAYWYFSVTDKKRLSVDSLLRALIAQLIIKFPVPPFLVDLWDARKMGREAPKATDLVQAIQKIPVVEPCRQYFVIMDALDESDENERADLMHLIRGLASLEADIHILVTSRTNTPGVEKEMKDLPTISNIAIERENADIDILAHVTERLEHDETLANWSPELRHLIKDTLIEKAGGMFRWVDCQLQAIRKCRKPIEVRKTLNTLPKDVHEVYARDLAKVDDNASLDVLRLMEWVAYPQQKLRIEEAVDMLAVDLESDSPAFDEENRIVDSEEILKMCGSLVRLDRNAQGRNDMGHVAQVQTIAAAHSSVIDFLKTQSIKIGSGKMVKFSRSTANLRMAEICLIYLRYFPANSITLTEDNITCYPFARLCALMWDNFYREVLSASDRVDMTRLNDLVMELFTSPSATLNWVRLSNPDEISEGVNFDIASDQLKPAIYYAALLGLPDIVSSLILEGSPVDAVVGPRFGTPLVAACAMGRADVVSMLLDSGADPNLSGYFISGTPLAAAIDFEELEILGILLGTEGIDINGRRHPPVQASQEVFESIEEYEILQKRVGGDQNHCESKKNKSRCIEIGAKLIELAKSAKVGDWGNESFRKRYGATGLIRADVEKQPNHSGQLTATEDEGRSESAVMNTSDVTHNQSFDINVTAASNRIRAASESIVYIAAKAGTLESLEMLLAAGANPNIRGGTCDTALQQACTGGDDEVVRILLRHGARTDVYGGPYGSSLNTAITYGRVQMIEDLIKASADVNLLKKPTPLQLASFEGRVDVVSLLLKHGAKPDICTADWSSPLQMATTKRNVESAQMLLHAGSHVDLKSDTGYTALYLACWMRDTKMVELLLANGADPNIQQCGAYDHALQQASAHGDKEIVGLLLKSGAKTDLHGGYYDNAFQAACESGNESVMRMLLPHGVDVNLRVGNLGPPLFTACGERGGLEIAKFLVETGADLSATDMVGRSVLLFAMIDLESALELVDYLIGLGVDPLLRDRRGCNALHYAARAKNVNVMERMLNCGIDVNETDSNGWSPLHWAIASTEDSPEIVSLLLQRGCDKGKTDKQGRTALDFAIIFNRIKEAAILDTTAHASIKWLEAGQSGAGFPGGVVCDGCGVARGYSKPESWHHCADCIEFDFCFRCVLDKDVIHFPNHAFSNEPA